METIILFGIGILIIFRLYFLAKKMMQPIFWEGLLINAVFFFLCYLIVKLNLIPSVFLSKKFGFLIPVWVAATYIFARFEIDLKQKKPKSRCFSLAVGRTSIAFIITLVLTLVLAIGLYVAAEATNIKIHPDLPLWFLTFILAWICFISENKTARFSVGVLAQIFFMGFLLLRLDAIVSTDVSGMENLDIAGHDTNSIGNQDTQVNNTNNNYDKVFTNSNDTSYINNDSYTYVHNTFDNNIIDNNFAVANTDISHIHNNTVFGQSSFESASNSFNFSEITKQHIQDSFGFSTATVTESATHVTITDVDNNSLFLYPDASGGYAIQGTDKLNIGHITAEGTILDSRSFAQGRISQVGNYIVLTDNMGMSIGHIDNTTGAIIDTQGMTVGKVRK